MAIDIPWEKVSLSGARVRRCRLLLLSVLVLLLLLGRSPRHPGGSLASPEGAQQQDGKVSLETCAIIQIVCVPRRKERLRLLSLRPPGSARSGIQLTELLDTRFLELDGVFPEVYGTLLLSLYRTLKS